MDSKSAIDVFAALAQETKLGAFRLLVKAGPKGLSAGDLAKQLGIPHNTLSFHLNSLSQANLVTSCKQGRSVIYSANYSTMQELIGYLAEDCCSRDVSKVTKPGKTGHAVIELFDCC